MKINLNNIDKKQKGKVVAQAKRAMKKAERFKFDKEQDILSPNNLASAFQDYTSVIRTVIGGRVLEKSELLGFFSNADNATLIKIELELVTRLEIIQKGHKDGYVDLRIKRLQQQSWKRVKALGAPVK